jgi:Tat protein secretion system quality control protein TatD with DNase activity
MERAHAFGVRKFIMPCRNLEECKKGYEICKAIPAAYMTVALSPEWADEPFENGGRK